MQNLNQDNSQNNYKSLGGIKYLGNLKSLLVMALFIALSMVFKQIAPTAGPIRLGFENLPLLLDGIIFGPVCGLLIGAVADIFGCIFTGYAINPIITVGAGLIGFTAGLISHNCFKNNPKLCITASVACAHILGSVIVKSIGLYVYYHYPPETLILRIPLYAVIGTIEGYITYMLMKNRAFKSVLDKVRAG